MEQSSQKYNGPPPFGQFLGQIFLPSKKDEEETREEFSEEEQ